MGMVQNTVIETNATYITVSYDPPIVLSSCEVSYRIEYRIQGNEDLIHYSTTTQTTDTFNYQEARLLCRNIEVTIWAIVGQVRGESYQTVTLPGI